MSAGVSIGAEGTAVAAGEGLRGVSGVQGWYRDAVADFVRHSAAEGREHESVGVFLIEPVAVVPAQGHPVVSFMREVVWKARYLALENELIGSGPEGAGRRAFSISPWQIEKIWKEAEVRQKTFFRYVDESVVVGKRYQPLMGLGHTHPGGAVGASVQDLAAFAAWKQMQDDLASEEGNVRLRADGHFVYSFGSFVDTLIMFDADGEITASVQGDFVSAVQ